MFHYQKQQRRARRTNAMVRTGFPILSGFDAYVRGGTGLQPPLIGYGNLQLLRTLVYAGGTLCR